MINKFYLNTPHGQIHGRGVDGLGTPIILLHRTPVCSSSFNKVLEVFAGKRRVIALDTPGFGQSFKPEGHPSCEDYARWLLAAVDALDIETFHLAAHHTGTHFAIEMAAMAPDRVRSLMLSGVLYESVEKRKEMREDIGLAPDIEKDGSHVQETWDLMKSLFLDYDAGLVQAETIGALSSPEGRNQAFDAIFSQNLSKVFRTVQCPVLVAQAADDPLSLTGMLTAFKKDFPHIHVQALGPAFLAAPERQPAQFCRAMLQAVSSIEPNPQNLLESNSMKNRIYHYVRSETGYDLEHKESTAPEPGPGEVLVKIKAVSLNKRDASIRDLSYPATGDEFIPLSDGAGDIIAIGEGVEQWQVGDKVMSAFFQNWFDGRATLPAVMSALGAGGPGVLGKYVLLSENGVIAMPEGWSYEDAACLPCSATTAWSGLMTLGQLQKDDTVVIIGTGGVAMFAIQIAAAAGAKPFVLSSSDEKLEKVKALGAVEGINYRETPKWSEKVRNLTNGAGVNHVMELGGAGTMEQSVASLGLNGHLAIIGALDGFGGEIQVTPLIFSAAKASAVMVGSQADHRAVVDFMDTHKIRPVIDSVYAFEDADKAFARMDEGAFGKIVIRVAE